MRKRTIENAKLADKIFGVDRPLGTFSARINLAYAFAYISEDVYRDLNTIRMIRNEFAHERGSLTFKDQTIVDKCNNLIVTRKHGGQEKEEGVKFLDPEESFNMAAMCYIGYFISRTEQSHHLTFQSGYEEDLFLHKTVRIISNLYWDQAKNNAE